MRPIVGAIGASTGVLSTIVAAGWTGATLILAVVVILTGGVCWVVADDKRSARLAMLLRACRSSATPEAIQQRRPTHIPR